MQAAKPAGFDKRVLFGPPKRISLPAKSDMALRPVHAPGSMADPAAPLARAGVRNNNTLRSVFPAAEKDRNNNYL